MNKFLISRVIPLFLAINFAVVDGAVPLSMSNTVDFRAVAKDSTPAVVSIRTSGSTTNTLTVESFLHDDRFEAFGDPFFDRFYGLPFPKSKMPQAKQPEIMGQASGFIISSDGLILTNSHVISDASQIIVTLFDGNEYAAKVVGQDPSTDVALIKIDRNDLTFLKLGDSNQLEVGEWVIAIGTPLGLQASLTAGVVSAVGRNNLELARIEDFIQTDAAVNQGNSGGPLLDLTGKVVGINTAIVTNKGGGGYIGIGFAIPSNIVSHIVEQLKTKGKVTRGFLGVSLQNIDKELATALGLSKIEGALVSEVTKSSPADVAGIKQGDVILLYNDRPVKDQASLRNTVALANPGDEATIGVLREGKSISLQVKIGELPSETVVSKAPEAEAVGVAVTRLGVTVGAVQGQEGVVITKVDANSPAAWVGLRKGGVVLAVNQKKVATPEEFDKAVAETEASKPLLMLIKQGETTRYISLQVGKN